MIFVTGDTHGTDFRLMSFKNWPQGRKLSRKDYLIILGDFGLLWNDPPKKTQLYWLDWLEERPWTTLFIDGNHENFDMLEKLPSLGPGLLGNEAGVVRENVYHLRRGNVYVINGKTFFCMGGAVSVDKEGGMYKTPDGRLKRMKPRIEGISWWKQEVPSYLEFEHALDSLEACGNEVDYVITHTAPNSFIKTVFGNHPYLQRKGDDPTSKFFDELLKRKIKFKRWYCGHFHEDIDYGPISFLYERILKIK